MSNINKMAFNEQLFTELTPEQGAVIEGGAAYYIGNKSGIGLNFQIDGQHKYLKPGQEINYVSHYQPVVVYDSKLGPGYVPQVAYPQAGPFRNNFDRVSPHGSSVYLFTGGGAPGANLVGANSL